MTVLIIDDSRIQRNILKGYLSELPATTGWEFFEAADGREALQTAEKIVLQNGKALHLILLDWNMPKMTGLDFLKELRTDRRFENTKVIMVTSDGAKSHVLDAIKNGASNFVLKPVNLEGLVEKISPLFNYLLP
jgi:two-component system chemotaxis response regulator CheY